MSELLQYQIGVYVNRNIYKTDASAELARVRAIRAFLRTGKSIRGVKIVGRWRNPHNRNPRHANWKTTEQPGESLYEFWNTLHGARGALRGLASRYGL
jgi:hypothetical protein